MTGYFITGTSHALKRRGQGITTSSPLAKLHRPSMTYHLPDTVLRRIIAILCRESARFTPSRKVLREIDQRIISVLGAIGAHVSGTEYSVAFREAADSLPAPRDRAEEFSRIASAENPLDPSVCSARSLVLLEVKAREIWAYRLASSPLNRPYHLIRAAWDELPEWQQVSVRQIAQSLEVAFRCQIDQGAPPKGTQNALLVELADLFLSATSQQVDRLELPHAPNSRFIQFVHEIARPFFAETEVSLKALSHRWLRWKKHNRSRPVRLRAATKQVRKRPIKRPVMSLKTL